MLFMGENALSGAPTISGATQFPKPPIMSGISIKKIIRKTWAVKITSYTWSSPIRDPVCPSSVRINILKDVPTVLIVRHHIVFEILINN